MYKKFDKTLKAAELYTHTHTHTHTCNLLLSQCKNCERNFCEKFFQKTKFIFVGLAVAFFCASAHATTDIQPNGNVAGGNTAANCTQPVLGTYSGSTNFEAKWRANDVSLRWYDEGNRITDVSSSSKTCSYDGTLTIPSTAPSRTGYTFGGWKVVQSLPSTYTELEYLQSSGTQYITTDWNPDFTKDFRITGKAKYIGGTSYRSIIFGNYIGSGGSFNLEFYSSGQFRVYLNYTGFLEDTKYGSFASGGIVEFDISYSVATHRYTLYITYNNATTVYYGPANMGTLAFSGRPMRMFLDFRSSPSAIQFPLAIYNITVWEQGSKIHHYVAAKKNSDNTLGMYDTVGGTFLTNSGSGTFTAGTTLN